MVQQQTKAKPKSAPRLRKLCERIAVAEGDLAEMYESRAAMFYELREDGWTLDAIAAAGGVSKAAVIKSLQRHRSG